MRHAGVKDVVTAGFKDPSEKSKLSPKKVRDWARENTPIDLTGHRSQSLTREMLQQATMILYMDTGNYKRLEAAWDAWGMQKERGPLDAITRPLGAFLAEPQKKIGDPMFQRPETAEFITIMGQLVEASGRFATYWQAMTATPLGQAPVDPLNDEPIVGAATGDFKDEEAAA